jgi:membrane protease YdiL (CAAX protease family)
MGTALLVCILSVLFTAKIGHPDWMSPAGRLATSTAFSAILAVVALIALAKRGRIRERLVPRWGDLSIGVVGAVALIVTTWAGRTLLSPRGVPRQAWLAQVYWFLGDPIELEKKFWIPWLVVLAPLLDEIVWRGWLQDRLSVVVPRGRGWILTGVLYGLQALPTLFTLSDASAGPNPLLLVMAMVAGLLFSFLTHITGRATPSMVAHAAFTYFMLLQFRPAL